MKETLEKLTLVKNYTINEETKEVEIFISDEDFNYKYQLETFLYFADKTYKIKTTLVKQ
jgi:hypothetical protein